ncbi:Rieske (2Fe-2S) iron-sulfur domain protein [Methanohalobium evestigatum Z-7303]|uniref:Rieske (2Fe-2S) iron-sulfur domain protein n=1 Tax=Methanohalobium evestigatum (strain ATCC BAA-1072 / DSM 3721 / NBRC 107634 / OCM 161 / Z-7303) TaxID=644295 RepID=D7EAM7_METEZ|nr:Rieske (2Fe-2S) protein [Methanohalobium evestigatum]ADI75026.1 Rieske (2Fe-2S) iron-sulfur domain protein [Methanohalobium evestigatum Z-7303]
MTESWVFAIDESSLQDNSLKGIKLEGNLILLVKIDREIYALSNKCAHMECLLSKGSLEGYTVKCPCHDWKFDVRTGEFVTANEIKIPTYQTKISEGSIYVNLEEGR